MERVPALVDKLECVYDVLNPQLIRTLSEENAPDIKVIPDSIITLTTVGRMVKLKGYDLAVDAAVKLKNVGIGFRWFFVGDGPMRELIEESIERENLSDSIILTGMKPNPYPYIKTADIYVQPSRFEGFGMTIGEAKILHKPIVSTNFEVVYDQITDGENGLVVEKSADSIANGIMRLVQNSEQREKIIHVLEAEENTTISTEVARVERLFDED